MSVDSAYLHVVAAVIVNAAGEVLITRRHVQAHQGDLWEFPGGKLEAGESVQHALARELDEELAITPTAARPLIRVRHDYPDKRVLLDVWRVDAWRGTPQPCEGQPLAWARPDDLPGYEFPAANLPIVTAARLPDRYLITPDPGPDTEAWLAQLARVLLAGRRLICLRAKGLDATAYGDLAGQALALCRAHGARLLLNADPGLVRELGADGVHLNSERLAGLSARPLAAGLWVAASCHDAAQLAKAAALGADFAVLSPVLPTASHPEAQPLGWKRFRELTDISAMPIYALGGMAQAHLDAAFAHGAQGIAAIQGLWKL